RRRDSKMTEPIEDPAQAFAEVTVWEFGRIKKHMGTQWPPGHFEVDISVNEATGRIHYGVLGFTYYLLEKMAVRAQREDKRSIVTMWRDGQCLAQRVVTPEGDFVAGPEAAGNN
ncbi:MAG: hypothetical protein M3P18_21840, partial [Actinomycetota bacterium]|nr:hypothetical protein [Actinomycetota bacterium]